MFHDAEELIMAIGEFIDEHNQSPKLSMRFPMKDGPVLRAHLSALPALEFTVIPGGAGRLPTVRFRPNGLRTEESSAKSILSLDSLHRIKAK